MNRHWRKYWWIPASILLFAFVSIYVVNLKNTQSQSLPVFHPADINPDLVDPHVDKNQSRSHHWRFSPYRPGRQPGDSGNIQK